ncbi:MAG: UDP-N-acetylmuramate dehydrogenase [Acidimicrobiales bacterium]|nr:UDP-N-acetylmuramate dehydrogenase [Acidimicrobiales bacterium]
MVDHDALNELIATLLDGPLALQVTLDAPLGARTTYGVGGTARALVALDTSDDVMALVEALHGTGVSTIPVGRGSNLLVADSGFAGVAVVMRGTFSDIVIDGTTIIAGGAAKLPVVARAAVNAGLSGFTWAVGVPGSIGGAIRMNAGGHGAEMADAVASADIVELENVDVENAGERTWSVDELDFGYRRSALRSSQLVLRTTLELEPGDVSEGKAEMIEIVQWRRNNQPGGQNAGSVFANPPGESAGRLIDIAGLKGFRIGSAEVSPKHANFIQSDPGGSADDVLALMKEIMRRVHDMCGVQLHAETHVVGFEEGTWQPQ